MDIKTTKACFAFMALVILTALTVQAGPKPPLVEKYKLLNGMRILLYPRHKIPGIAFQVFFRTGSVDEEMGQTGLAHMFEHMAFKGTKTLNTKDYAREKAVLEAADDIAEQINRELAKPGKPDLTRIEMLKERLMAKEKEAEEFWVKDEYERIYEANGAWNFNAFTSNDVTAYTVSLPSNRLDLWLAMEADRFQNAVAREFYRERDVVIEERRMRIESNPFGKLYELFMADAFIVSPYRHEVGGWMGDIQRLTARQADEFFKTRYTPDRCVIAIVGDIDTKETLEKLKYHFEWIPSRQSATEFPGDEPTQTGERRVELIWDAEPVLLMGWHKPNAPHPDDARLALLKGILSDGRTSRFYKNLVERDGIAQNVSVYNEDPGTRYPNLFLVLGYPRNPYTAQNLETAIDKEIEAVKKIPPQPWELERVRNNIEAGLVNLLEENEGIANSLGTGEIFYNDWSYSWKLLGTFEKIKPEELSEVARKYLTRENKTVGYITKKKAGEL